MRQPHFQLMSRSNCCLCEKAKEAIDLLASQGLCTWETVDVDRDKALLVRYGLDVPVLLNDDEMVFKHSVTVDGLKAYLESRTVIAGGEA